MNKPNDIDNLIKRYESIYGEKNPKDVVEKIISEELIKTPIKRKRKRSRRKSTIVTESVKEQTSDKTIVEDNNFNTNKGKTTKIGEKDMSKFEQLFKRAIKEQFEEEDNLESGMEGVDDMEGMEGMDDEGQEFGEDSITITLDRELAEKLCEIITSAIGGDDEDIEFSDEEGLEMDFEGEEEDEETFEEGAEDNAEKFNTEPAISKFTGKSNKVTTQKSPTQKIAQSGRGAQASHKPQTPKAIPPQK